jgi:stress response protein SCP2
MKINDCDLVTVDSELSMQAMKMQYKIVQGLLFEENPNFDVEKMEYKIDNLLVKVKTTNQQFNQFKGEFFAVNEPIINKDLLVFKLERVQRHHEKQ